MLSEPPGSPEVQALYDEDRESDGYVGNLTHLWAWRPDVADGFAGLRAGLLARSDLSEVDVAVLVVATAAARSDSYCALAWGTRLAGLSGEDIAARVASGAGGALDARSGALAAWARQVVLDPNGTTDAELDALRTVGLDDRQIFEATALVSFRLAFSTVNDALGARPDAQLAEAAPSAVRSAIGYGRAPAVTPST